MQPRREPLLWLQCLALGAIPLELLLIRLVLAGADPGPVPGVERVLIWGVGVLAPAVALWRRPADWGSLLLVRQPLVSRNSEQLRISASHSGIISRVAVAVAAVILLPVLWWLDDSAVLVREFSPVSGQSRLVTLLLVSPLSALIVWQLQQLVQAGQLLLGSTGTVAPDDSGFRADALATQRTSLGLQLLNIPALDWPEPEAAPEAEQTKTVIVEESAEETNLTSDQEADAAIAAQSTEPETKANDSAEDVCAPDDSSEIVKSEEECSAFNKSTAEASDQPEVETLDPVAGEIRDDGSEEDRSEEDSAGDADDVKEEDTTPSTPTDSSITAAVSGSGDQNQEHADIDEESDTDQPNDRGRDEATGAEVPDEESAAINPTKPESSDQVDAETASDVVDVSDQDTTPSTPTDSSVSAAAPLPVKPEQAGEEEKGSRLDSEIGQVDTVASGSTESHREQAEPSRRKESEPEKPS